MCGQSPQPGIPTLQPPFLVPYPFGKRCIQKRDSCGYPVESTSPGATKGSDPLFFKGVR